MSLYAKEITAEQTKIPTDTSKRGLLAIVVTREDIHVFNCVKTTVRPSRLATTSAGRVTDTFSPP